MISAQLESQAGISIVQVIHLPTEIWDDPSHNTDDDPQPQMVTSFALDWLLDADPQQLQAKFIQLHNIDIDWSDPDDWLDWLRNNTIGEFVVIAAPTEALTDDTNPDADLAELLAHPKTIVRIGTHPTKIVKEILTLAAQPRVIPTVTQLNTRHLH